MLNFIGYFFQYAKYYNPNDYSYFILKDAIDINMITIISGKKVDLNSISDDCICFFTEWHPLTTNLEFLKALKRKNIKLVLIIRNKLHTTSFPIDSTIEELKGIYDIIISTDISDYEKYHFKYLPNPFSKVDLKHTEIVNDLVFVGRDKGRIDLLNQIAISAENHGAKADISVVGDRREYVIDNIKYTDYVTDNIKYTDYVPYLDILEKDISSNCILEVVSNGQNFSTLRYQEAVCLGRKLLTNNKSILQEKYYDPRFMRYFDSVENIDWDFVKETKVIDYNYQNDFSPIRYLERIIIMLERRFS